ncbi:type IV secretory system conjugative DNA transfer family protein [Haloarcula nitratireducens]|uniref:Type IV secretion system DNA-binding domain-containing protein n=1 Tax=Haloarcula nitratireducens TaxID=2487749 RepID=A0AAW4PG32_9EURY|nr:type IV secretion system DNA-binding domain-containing protein [Halomicroarcula nitratireducens]MBX0296934.1 type IV secretion system DNA-binding domain-containing protein [Halomicroarcula nitratireducens]
MANDSQSPRTAPGQKPGEMPTSLKYNEPAMLVWSVFMLLVPPMWIDSDKLLHRRFWAWRYIYCGFTIITGLLFVEPLLSGSWLVLLLAPFAHLLGAALVVGLFAGFQVPGVAPPVVSYETGAALYVSSLVLIGVIDVARRTSPRSLARNPWGCEDDELAVPYESVKTKNDAASALPTLKDDVSTAVLGETGSGKSSAMQLLAYQFPYNRDTAIIAHDAGEEFQQFYADLGFDVKRVGIDGDVTWNLFRDADSRQDFREIAAAVFGNPSGHNPFHTPAKQVFEDMLRYLHLEAQRNNRRENLSHMDIVSLLEDGRAGIYDALDSYDQLESGHLDTEQGKAAQNVYQTLVEYTRPIFVEDFAEHGSFSLREYIRNPEGRVLIVDSRPSRMATLGPMFQLLLDWSIRFAMESPNPTVHVLDEIDQLPPLGQITNLTARGRKEKARALIGVQTIGQLSDTYSDISGILGNCPQGLYFGPGDSHSTEFIRNEIGERRVLDRRETHSMSRQSGSHSHRSQARESYQETEKAPITSGQLRDFEPGECITVTRTDWWYGQTHELHEVRSGLPERGAESPETPRQTDSEGDVTETDSWIAMVKHFAGRIGRSNGDGTEQQSDAETDPDVWAADDVNETPSITYSDRRWRDALSRLDVEAAPVTRGQNVDALSDLGAMLDRRVLDLPQGTGTTLEIREMLTDLYVETGLTPTEVLDAVEKRTTVLRMSDAFRDDYRSAAEDADSTIESPDADEEMDTPETLFEEEFDSKPTAESDGSPAPEDDAELENNQVSDTASSNKESPRSPEDDVDDIVTDTSTDDHPEESTAPASSTAESDAESESDEDDFDAADFM